MQIQRKGSLSGVSDTDIARPFDKYAILTEVTRLNHDPDSWHRSRSVRAISTGTRNTHGYPKHRAPSRQGYVLRESVSHACGRRRVTAGVFFSAAANVACPALTVWIFQKSVPCRGRHGTSAAGKLACVCLERSKTSHQRHLTTQMGPNNQY